MSDALVQSATIQLKAQAGGGFGSVPSGAEWVEGQPPAILSVSALGAEGSEVSIATMNTSANRSGQLYYDDFSSGINGNDITGLLGNVGVYKYDSSDSFTGGQCAKWRHNVGDPLVFPRVDFGLTHKAVFVRAAQKLVQVTGGNDNDGARQIKLWRTSSGPTIGKNDAPQIGITYSVQGGKSEAWADAGAGQQNMWGGLKPTLGKWQTCTMYLDSSDENIANGARMMKMGGEHSFEYSAFLPGGHFNNPIKNGVVPATDWVAPKTTETRVSGAIGTGTRGFYYPFYMRSSMSYDVFVDNVFANDSYERVEIGDAVTYSSCDMDKLVIQRMVSRSSGEIKVNLKKGGHSGSQSYLYVFNADGLCNEVGFDLGVLA